MRPRTTIRNMRRSRAVLAASAALASLALTTGVGIASAASTLPLLGSFGNQGDGAGELALPRGVAVDLSGDSSRGDVYVADSGNRRVEKFGSVGNFLLAFGKEVDATKVREAGEPGRSVSEAEEDICTARSGDVCQSGTEGGAKDEFEGTQGVAVDPSSGSIYVEDRPNHRVAKYAASGEFLLMFGGHVNATTGGDVCTAAELCQAGVAASSGEVGEGAFHPWGVGALIAVGSSGTVYVGDENRVQEFTTAGVYQGQIELPGAGRVTALAVDSSGNAYVKAQLLSGVGEYAPSGLLLRTFDEGSESIAGVAVDPAGNVSVIDFETGELRVLKYDSAGNALAESSSGLIANSTGIAANESGTVYVSDFEPETSTAKLLLFGSPPGEGNPPPAIDAEFASNVGTDNAALGAEINPAFLPTTYYVQYGESDSYSKPAVPAPVSLGAENLGDDHAGALLEGLTPGTTYHYRFVAVSKAGETLGADHTFTTRQTNGFELPDGRAFELVSPSENNSAEVGLPPAGGETLLPLQATPQGESIAYTSFTAFGAAQSAPAASQYIARRTQTGWATQNITPPDREGYLQPPLRGFSTDLANGVIIQREPTLAPGAIAGYENLYLRDDTDGALKALTTATPRVAPGEKYCDAYAGASADFKHVIFMATGALTSNAPEAPGRSLYEWSQAAGLRLVSVLPGETPAQPNGRTGFGAGEGLGCSMGDDVVNHAISADGSRIFWTYHPEGANPELLVRENGVKTIQVDAPQGGAGAAGGGKFWAASTDGSKVFFTDREPLTADATAASETSLYEYDLNSEKLTDLTPVPVGKAAKVLGVLGASEDGSYVYFAAEGALAEGATAGHANLYVRHGSEAARFIATLSVAHTLSRPEGDRQDWSEEPKQQTARVTPDGRHLAFVSVASLKGYENVDRSTGEPDSEVYLYDAESASLVCASCNSSGARPMGPSSVPAWYTPYQQPRYLSDTGGRLFFDSFDALALHNTNGTQNVYEFEADGLGSCTRSSASFSENADGCIFSISTGTSGDNSSFLDASADGRDVFFSTRQGLVRQDENERFDIYDARVEGGFPQPPQPPPACVEEAACRPASPTAPLFGSPGSVTFSGAGNLIPPTSEVKPVQARRLSRAQELAKALRACKKKPRKKRAACVKQAGKKYGSKAAAKRSKSRARS